MKDSYEMSPKSYNLYNYWHRIIACLLGISLLILPLIFNTYSSSWQSCLLGSFSTTQAQIVAPSIPTSPEVPPQIANKNTSELIEKNIEPNSVVQAPNDTTNNSDLINNKVNEEVIESPLLPEVVQPEVETETTKSIEVQKENNQDLDKPEDKAKLGEKITPAIQQNTNIEQNTIQQNKIASYKGNPPFTKIYFRLDQHTLPVNSQKTLSNIINYMKAQTKSKVLLIGYHDHLGKKDLLKYNKELALKRAESVKSALIKVGIQPSRIILSKPKNSIGSGENWQARRVDVRVIKK